MSDKDIKKWDAQESWGQIMNVVVDVNKPGWCHDSKTMSSNAFINMLATMGNYGETILYQKFIGKIDHEKQNTLKWDIFPKFPQPARSNKKT